MGPLGGVQAPAGDSGSGFGESRTRLEGPGLGVEVPGGLGCQKPRGVGPTTPPLSTTARAMPRRLRKLSVGSGRNVAKTRWWAWRGTIGRLGVAPAPPVSPPQSPQKSPGPPSPPGTRCRRGAARAAPWVAPWPGTVTPWGGMGGELSQPHMLGGGCGGQQGPPELPQTPPYLERTTTMA